LHGRLSLDVKRRFLVQGERVREVGYEQRRGRSRN
jgi:hypothetical protein